MNEKHKLPSFFVVGGQKCGTTTLHDWFKQDSRISLPLYKETHFFSTSFSYGFKWYIKQFNNKNYQIRGEVDPSYMLYPDAFNRINNFVSNPKFIFIFRKPLDRAYSHYLMSFNRGYDSLSFIDAINNEKDRLENDNKNFSFSNHSYLLRSNYSIFLEKYFELFNREKCIFIKFDDLHHPEKRKKIYSRLYKFLDIDFCNHINLDIQSNKAYTYNNKFVRDNLYKKTKFRHIMKKIIFSKKIRNFIRSNVEKINKVELDDKILEKNKTKAFYLLPNEYKKWNNNEVRKLNEITNLDLDDWLI